MQLTDVHHPGNDVGHPCGHPSVSYDDDEITIKSDSTIYDVGVVVKDQYGNVMHQSTQMVGSEGTVIYVPDTGGDSEKTTIDLYYDELYRQPKSITEKQVRETERREHEWNFSEQ
ncbi:hypothetical protein [Prevotella sp. CAG:592]|uniref:hypothetical protein n=1 Tax=Prevotella sp. CAG:592 TaxID=1262931 RepID=UPI00258991C9|nr:hypothetical protein [Prevotella sp. CAG:592]